MSKTVFEASGKFLLFGEYLVLRGATCLAMPLRYGQTLTVEPGYGAPILWRSFEKGKCWLEIILSENLEVIQANDKGKAAVVQTLLQLIRQQNPDLSWAHHYFKFELDFERRFGMGTSATLLSLMGRWSGVDPYFLLEKTFGGSGYDIAAATAKKPFFYSMADRLIKEIYLPDDITKKLLFVYSGKKQKSAEEVFNFKNSPANPFQLTKMNEIVKEAALCNNIQCWEELMHESEQLLSEILKKEPVRERFFADYPYQIKSMGAWGGDFIMASCREVEEAKAYFHKKNKKPVYTYSELVK